MSESGSPTIADLSGISLQQLRYIIAVGSSATFAEIASDLDVTQSAISQGISRLETILGTDIVEPVGRSRRLTSAGEEVALYAGQVLEASERLLEAIGEYREGRSGTLRIGMVDAAALYIFDQAIADFHNTNPNVELSVVVDASAELLDRLKQFQDEIAVVVSPAIGFETTELRSESLHLYGPSEDWERGSWVLYPSGSHTRELIDEGLRSAGFRPRSIIESDNPEIQRQLARMTDSWTVLPERVAEAGEDPLNLVRSTIASRTFVVARRTGSKLSEPARTFIETLLGV